VLLSAPPADADRADHLPVDDHRHAPFEGRHFAPARRGRLLQAEVQMQVRLPFRREGAGLLAEGGRGHRLGLRRVPAGRSGPVQPVIYQLVVRYFGNTNTTNRRDGSLAENGCGRFADVTPAALAGIRGLGATHVWLTGCLRQATLTDHSALGLPPDDPDVVKGIAGSLYAVKDCFDVCPDYALDPARRLEEFEALIGRVHQA